jgi:protocatechuate 3,4-dioxygenase beta subunit
VLTRRELIRYIGTVPVIAACSSKSNSSVDATTPADASAPDAPVVLGPWATGGTAAMTDKATYPDPFTAPATGCMIIASSTAGPCTTATDLARVDVSEGWTGLPVRLALRFMTAACAPIAGAVVKIWHTNIGGSYSGVTPNPVMCLKDQSYSTSDFFRGVQTTAADGTVYFDTCFPGWYAGRAIHIHFQITNGATVSRVSQLFFPEALTQDIFASHSEYVPYGQPDTTFANDGVYAAIPTSARPRSIVQWAQMTDGAMLASKTITVTL